jgi:hypothetical protein
MKSEARFDLGLLFACGLFGCLAVASGCSAPKGSGQATCENSQSCGGGMACEHATVGTSGICAAGCQLDSDCAKGHSCISGRQIGFASSCLQQCSTVSDCAAEFDCVTISGGKKVCVPFDWESQSQPQPPPQANKGIGDVCTSNSECASGMCAGWCTAACSPTNAGCYGSHAGNVANQFGEVNWCMATTNGDFCFAACTNPSDCSNYPGTTCKQGMSVDGHSVSVCAK